MRRDFLGGEAVGIVARRKNQHAVAPATRRKRTATPSKSCLWLSPSCEGKCSRPAGRDGRSPSGQLRWNAMHVFRSAGTAYSGGLCAVFLSRVPVLHGISDSTRPLDRLDSITKSLSNGRSPDSDRLIQSRFHPSCSFLHSGADRANTSDANTPLQAERCCEVQQYPFSGADRRDGAFQQKVVQLAGTTNWPKLSAFLPQNLWPWIWHYLKVTFRSKYRPYPAMAPRVPAFIL